VLVQGWEEHLAHKNLCCVSSKVLTKEKGNQRGTVYNAGSLKNALKQR